MRGMKGGETDVSDGSEAGLSRRRFLRAVGFGLGMTAVPLGARRALALGAADGRLQLALVRATRARDLTALAAFDETHARRGDWIEVLLWPGDRARLDRLGLEYRITEPDLVARDQLARTRASSTAPAHAPGQRSDYRRLADYEADLRGLAAAHPTMTRLLELPYPSHEGHRLLALEIASRVERSDGRPVFYMDGLHHAREWPAGEMTIMFAHDLLESYATDRRVGRLLKRVRVVVVPVVNPDGFHYSREFLVDASGQASEGAYWRKNRRTFVHDVADYQPAANPVRGVPAGQYGVDLNRNYSYHWGGPGASWDYTNQTHHGPPPYEPEIHNVQAIFAARHVTAAITNHTYSELVLRPWGDTWANAPDEAVLRQLGDAFAATNGYWSMKGIGLYPTSGTTEDWAYATFGTLCYTFEHGTSFHPPYAESIPEMYLRNREAFLLGAEAAARPEYHAVLTGRVPERAEISVRRAAYTPFYFWDRGIVETVETAMQTGRGRFTYHLCPSTRPIAEEPEAYEVEITSASGSAKVDVVVGRGEMVDLGEIELS